MFRFRIYGLGFSVYGLGFRGDIGFASTLHVRLSQGSLKGSVKGSGGLGNPKP